MGSYCSIHNDTKDETVMVFVGANTKVLKPILWTITALATAMSSGAASGMIPGVVGITLAAEYTLVVSVSTLTAVAGGVVTTTNWVLDRVQNQVVADLSKGGYHKILPGQTWTSARMTCALNLRAWVVRIQKTEHAVIIRRASSSVFTGSIPGSSSVYSVMDTFSNWRIETIPVKEVVPKETPAKNDEQYSLLDAGKAFALSDCPEEDPSSSWVQVNAVEAESKLDCDSFIDISAAT
mmetsp:Transcript_11867/g.18206  ORF Transcript_11867/g.18206 Transcript_11867/m.18206 type:complete len:237 (+) Transcript_11867:244-954(+)|eukprot:CAMPEP_0178906320 /NCGR_PEP_ID=MMETSP0786-20121207/6756_1 /TAXON_ID=186022 /ORGANISM="Thalassionema frauenfeldii, Strain CCMP 1798" /LENGTH=236 /DNA_ID=CAMNT_0020578007 /DNA_START=192 /DNA_END=902 /DNA_ORIENTATION=+